MKGDAAARTLSAIDALRRSRRLLSMDAARGELDDRITSVLRLVLAVAASGVHLLDPTEGPGRRIFTGTVLSCFAIYAAVMHVQVVRRATRLPRDWMPWIDVGWVTLLVVASTGTSSIFFPMYLFAILCAAFGRGFRGGMAVTAASVLSFAVIGGVTTPGGAAFELDRSLVRPLYLLILGYLMSHWGAHENRARARLALLREVSVLSNPRFGVEHTVGHVLATLRAFYDADACHLVVTDAARSEAWMRTASRLRAESGPPVPLPAELADVMLPEPATAALVCGWRWGLGLRPLRRSEVIDLASGDGARPAPDTSALESAIGAPSFLSVPFRYDAGALGRVYVIASQHRAFDALDVELLLGVLDRVMPVVDNIRLVDRLATDAAEEERQRIARNLHDSVIQPYIGLHLGVRATRDALARGDTASAHAFAEKLERVAAGEIDTLRGFVHSVRGAGNGRTVDVLAASLQRFSERFETATGIAVEVVVEGSPVSDRVAAEVLQIVAEALSNVRRHTDSSRASVRVSADGARLILRVENDFAEGGPAAPFSPWSIHERAEALGGKLEVLQAGGRTAIQVEIPL